MGIGVNEEQINRAMGSAAFHALKLAQRKVDNKREPLLRKVLAGEKMTDSEMGALNVLSELFTEFEKLAEEQTLDEEE